MLTFGKSMRRPIWILAVLALCACQRAPEAGSLLPAGIAGRWQRTSLDSIPPRQPGVARAFAAAYEGPGHITVDLYETKATGVAFEMTQHWREAANSVFFDKGVYFVVVKWQPMERQALRTFIREFETELGAKTH